MVLLVLNAIAATARPYKPIEIWVTPYGSGGGRGTQLDPYSTPDADSFFNLINDQRLIYATNVVNKTNITYATNTLLIPEYSTIHLMPGTFVVEDGTNSAGRACQCITMKQGWKVRGAGMNKTVIQVISNAPALFLKIHVFDGTAITGAPGASTGVVPLLHAEVSDLTVDCNLQNQSSSGGCIAAVVMFGSHNKVSRVKAINWGSTVAGAECFLFNLGPSSALSASDTGEGLIENCVVAQPAQVVNYCDTIAFCTGSNPGDTHRSAWKIQGCVVRDVSNAGYAPFYAFGASNNGEVSDCVAYNLSGNASATYNDTVDSHDIVYRNNKFLNVASGITYNGSDSNVTNLAIIGNMITSTNISNGFGINLYMPTNSMQGVKIEGNVIRPAFPGASMTGALAINGVAASITFSADNNTLDAGGHGGWDFFCNGPAYKNLNCLSFVNNLSGRGQPLFYGTYSNGITSALYKSRR